MPCTLKGAGIILNLDLFNNILPTV